MSETTLVVLQPGYLPWLGFFDQMRRADMFVYYDDVQYDKHGWRNRNRIKAPSGPLWLTVPVRHHGQGRPLVKDTLIADRSWIRKHVASCRQYYSRAPFLDRYLPELTRVLEQNWDSIADLDIAVTDLLRGWLGVTTPVTRASHLNIGGGQTERLVNICRHYGATRYLSGSAARDYLDVSAFEAIGAEVAWQDYQHPVYPQQHGAFVPYLSVIDLLFNCGDQSREILSGASSV